MQGPGAQPCHLCRSSSTPGKLPPRAVFVFTCPVCKRARRGRFQSQPQNSGRSQPASPAPGYAPHPAAELWVPAPWSAPMGAGTPKCSRILPALPGLPLPCASSAMPECRRARPRFHRTPSPSAVPGRQENRGQAKGKGRAATPLTLIPSPSPGLVPNLQPGQDPNRSRIELHLPGS